MSWVNQSKATTSLTNQTHNTSTGLTWGDITVFFPNVAGPWSAVGTLYTNLIKTATSLSNQTEHSTSFSNQSKSSTSFTNQIKN